MGLLFPFSFSFHHNPQSTLLPTSFSPSATSAHALNTAYTHTMARIKLGLVGLLALSSAVSMVNAHEGHHHEEEQANFNLPGDAHYGASDIEVADFKVSALYAYNQLSP